MQLAFDKFDNQRLAGALQFFLKLNLFAAPLYIMLFFGIEFAPMQSAVRDLTFQLLSVLQFNPAMSGYMISIPVQNGSWGAFINWDCTGWKSMLAFIALVMATPVIKKKRRGAAKGGNARSLLSDPRIKGLVIFLPLIFLVNLARIIFMFWFVKTYDIALYPLVHASVWSWGLIIAVLALWIIWTKKMR